MYNNNSGLLRAKSDGAALTSSSSSSSSSITPLLGNNNTMHQSPSPFTTNTSDGKHSRMRKSTSFTIGKGHSSTQQRISMSTYVSRFLMTCVVLLIPTMQYVSVHFSSSVSPDDGNSKGLRGVALPGSGSSSSSSSNGSVGSTSNSGPTPPLKGMPTAPKIPTIPALPSSRTQHQQQSLQQSPPSQNQQQNDPWTPMVDKETRKVYWWNKGTGETTGVGVPKPRALPSLPKKSNAYAAPKKALIFTMDSIDSYVANSKTGGPAGEILIRESLQLAFDLLNVHYDVMTSDMQLGKVNPNNYDFIILDPWTWAAKGWKPKPFIRGQEKKIYMLDFFGSDKLKGSNPDFHLPPSRFLTAFKTGEQGESNTFLGYSMNLGINPPKEFEMYAKKNQGVIWGKSVNYLKTHVDFLKQLADIVELHSSCIVPVFKHSNMKWHGSLSKNEWQNLLRESKFMIGLGDPLLGPSAMDAISAGAVYINPIYKNKAKKIGGRDKLQNFNSQHPYAENFIGEPSVCNYNEDSAVEALSCVQYALSKEIEPFIPKDFTQEAHVARVKTIFGL